MKASALSKIIIVILIATNVLTITFIYELNKQVEDSNTFLYAIFKRHFFMTTDYLLNDVINNSNVANLRIPLYEKERVYAEYLLRSYNSKIGYRAEDSILYRYFNSLSFQVRRGYTLTNEDIAFLKNMYDKRVVYDNEISLMNDEINREGLNKNKVEKIIQMYIDLNHNIEEDNMEYLSETLEKLSKLAKKSKK